MLPKKPNILSVPINSIIIKKKIAQILLNGIKFNAIGKTTKHNSAPYN